MKKKATLSEIRRAASLARKTFSGGTNGGAPRSSSPCCACDADTITRAVRRANRNGACPHPMATVSAAASIARQIKSPHLA